MGVLNNMVVFQDIEYWQFSDDSGGDSIVAYFLPKFLDGHLLIIVDIDGLFDYAEGSAFSCVNFGLYLSVPRLSCTYCWEVLLAFKINLGNQRDYKV